MMLDTHFCFLAGGFLCTGSCGIVMLAGEGECHR